MEKARIHQTKANLELVSMWEEPGDLEQHICISFLSSFLVKTQVQKLFQESKPERWTDAGHWQKLGHLGSLTEEEMYRELCQALQMTQTYIWPQKHLQPNGT